MAWNGTLYVIFALILVEGRNQGNILCISKSQAEEFTGFVLNPTLNFFELASVLLEFCSISFNCQ